MSDPALALSFFDPAREIYGTARSGTTILFEGRRPVRHAEGPALRQIGEGWRAELAEVLELELAPVAETAELGDLSARVCRVTGRVAGRAVECFGTVAETRSPPIWEQLDALRTDRKSVV